MTNWVLSWAGRTKVVNPTNLRDRLITRREAAIKRQREPL
ncbi:MAG: hypothetical protein ACYTG0_32435 [Planctomycetota bacterium]